MAWSQYVLIIVGVAGDAGRYTTLQLHDVARQGVCIFNIDSKMVHGCFQQIRDRVVRGRGFGASIE